MANRSEEVRASGLVESFLQGRLTRRQLIERAAALGVGAGTLGAMLSAPGLGVRSTLAQGGGELIVAAGGDIDTTDPHVSQLLVFNNTLRFNVFNALVKYGPDMGYVGDLAETWE